MPGRTWRWKSASAAVLVSRGSITISDRAGSLAISFKTTRERGKPCECHGFLPTNIATSARSKSGVVWQRGRPNSWPSTHDSPVFSCASAFDMYRTPNAARVEAAYAPPRWLPWPPPP